MKKVPRQNLTHIIKYP